MSDEIYKKLAGVLDTLPNGFPATDSGLEIKILKNIFTPEEADLFCDLRLTPETAEEIAKRTGRPLKGLAQKLTAMYERGEILQVDLGGAKYFRMVPWVVGIYEFQIRRMDAGFAQMCEEYMMHWGAQFMMYGPQVMHVVPIEEEITAGQEALPYEQVSHLLEDAKSFMVNDCICRKEQALLGHGCAKPLQVCLGLGPLPGMFHDNPLGGRVITKEEAREVLRKSEEAGLVHLTSNVQNGHFFICNCCGCCCGVLRSINMGLPNVTNSNYYAEIDPEACSACGICLEERCQIKAIEEGDNTYSVNRERCIGCGLCVTTCPSEAIRLVRKAPEKHVVPPKDEDAWLAERARQRGVDYSAYK
ncbi:MAG: 4Fe-4S binding protein [bacterium]